MCKGRSKRSLFRDLSLFGYFSSYSRAGKFYTLANIPNLDEYGLWHYDLTCCFYLIYDSFCAIFPANSSTLGGNNGFQKNGH